MSLSDPLSTLGGAVDSFFASGTVQTVIYASALYLAVVWLAAAYWAFRDTQDRTENLVLPFLSAALILVSTPFLFPLGILVYRIVRPPERLGDVYERNLAEETLLAEAESIRTCRGCDRRVDNAWIICPWCRTRLNRICPNCEEIVGMDWTLCAWCGRDFERRADAPLAPAPSTPAPAADAMPPDDVAWDAPLPPAARPGLGRDAKGRPR